MAIAPHHHADALFRLEGNLHVGRGQKKDPPMVCFALLKGFDGNFLVALQSLLIVALP